MYNHNPKSNAAFRKNHKTADRKGGSTLTVSLTVKYPKKNYNSSNPRTGILDTSSGYLILDPCTGAGIVTISTGYAC